MEKWIFTFGLDNKLFGKNYVVFTGTYHDARYEMENAFGDHWAFQYTEDEGLAIAKKHVLTKLVIGKPVDYGEENDENIQATMEPATVQRNRTHGGRHC